MWTVVLVVSLLSSVWVTNGQACAGNSLETGGGTWAAGDYPKDLETQDFSQLVSPPSATYKYINNSDKAGYDTYWVPYTGKTLESPNVRVMGFKFSLVHEYNRLTPCVTITAAKYHGVEIMLYASEDVDICIRDRYQASTLNSQEQPLFTNVCANKRLRHCFIAPDERDLAFDIYVDQQQPNENTVGVFYRIRKSQYSYKDQGTQFTTGNTEMWCGMVSGSVDSSYPEFTGDVPTGFVAQPTNGAGSILARHGALVWAVVAVAVFALGA